MKSVRLVVHEPSVNRLIGSELSMQLQDDASIVDVITEVDRLISSRREGFPLPDYKSFLHMTYNPVENRFYKQVAVTAYDVSGQMLNVREDPKKPLPNGVTVILIPAGGCISEWEEAVSYDAFVKALLSGEPRFEGAH